MISIKVPPRNSRFTPSVPNLLLQGGKYFVCASAASGTERLYTLPSQTLQSRALKVRALVVFGDENDDVMVTAHSVLIYRASKTRFGIWRPPLLKRRC